MILILSDKFDVSTHYVIDWLSYLKIPFICINEMCDVSVEELSIIDSHFDFILAIKYPAKEDIVLLHSNNIDAYWYRRGFLRLSNKDLENVDIDVSVLNAINLFTWEEKEKIIP